MNAPRSQPGQQQRLRPQPWIPLLLGLLALYDLRVELQLLADHLTLAGIRAAIASHPLAVAVLLLLPSLLRRP